MSDLSPELQQLVLAGRMATLPTDADSERVLRGLDARLGVAVGVASGAMAATVTETTTRALSAKVIGLAAAGVALVVGGVSLLVSFAGSASPTAAPAAENAALSSLPETAAIFEVAPTLKEAQSPSPAPLDSQLKAVPAAASSRGSSRARDSLAEEVAILSRAETELHSGRAENALRLLSEHERKYRNGTLAEERTAARIQALCALGRGSEANAQLARLSPQSLHGEATRQACTSPKKPTARQTTNR